MIYFKVSHRKNQVGLNLDSVVAISTHSISVVKEFPYSSSVMWRSTILVPYYVWYVINETTNFILEIPGIPFIPFPSRRIELKYGPCPCRTRYQTLRIRFPSFRINVIWSAFSVAKFQSFFLNLLRNILDRH